MSGGSKQGCRIGLEGWNDAEFDRRDMASARALTTVSVRLWL
jgi:hypothetical protein